MNKLGKRLIAGGLAAATALSLLVGSTFKEPAELLTDDNRPVIVEYAAPPEPDTNDGGADAAAPEEKKKGLRERIRLAILKLPLSVRLLVCLPAWFAGWALIALGGAVWSSVLAPTASVIVNVLLTALVLLGLAVLSIKTARPDMPLKKIINRRNISLAIVCAVLGETCFILLQLLWPEWDRYYKPVRSLVALALILAAALFGGRRKKAAKE